MRDLLYVLYILLCLALVRFVNRTPVWMPRTFRARQISYVAESRPMGCFTVLFLLMRAAIGAYIPNAIAGFLQDQRSVYPESLDAVGRLAQIVGGVCGAYAGLRASWLWLVLFLVGGGLYVLNAAVNYAVGGSGIF